MFALQSRQAVSTAFPLQMWPDAEVWTGVVMMVVWALLLAVVVLAIVRVILVPVLERTESSGGDDLEPAMQILRERFARGDIDEEEFERRARTLRQQAER